MGGRQILNKEINWEYTGDMRYQLRKQDNDEDQTCKRKTKPRKNIRRHSRYHRRQNSCRASDKERIQHIAYNGNNRRRISICLK